MNPDAQRIAIREACGWSRTTGVMHYDGAEMPWTIWTRDGVECGGDKMPNELSDLNAMHEAEKVLLIRQQASKGFNTPDYGCYSRYIGLLRELNHHGYGKSERATAAQRAEAFLKTLGKWEESG